MPRKTGLVIKATLFFRPLKQPNPGVLFQCCPQGTFGQVCWQSCVKFSPHCLNPAQPSTAQQPRAGSSEHPEPRARLCPNPNTQLKNNLKHSEFYSEDCLKITVKLT